MNHPDKLAEARGLCANCYQKAYYRGQIDTARRKYTRKPRKQTIAPDAGLAHRGAFPKVRLPLRPEDVFGTRACESFSFAAATRAGGAD